MSKLTPIANDLSKKLKSIDLGTLPPEPMMVIIGSPDRQHFVNAMIRSCADIISQCNVKPDSSLLDIGCGVGRLAIPFSHYLSKEGKYVGTDVWPDGIEWCHANIESKHTNFSFKLMDVVDNYYYTPERSGKKNSLKMEFVSDLSIDTAFAISVFTHLVKDDAQQYLNELYRVLKKGGYAYLTFFVIDQHFHKFSSDTGRHKSLKKVEPGAWYAYSGKDFFAGYEKPLLEKMFAEAGLEVVSCDLGKWAKKPNARLYQDFFLLQRC